MHLGTIFHCLIHPSSLIIPSTVREIGAHVFGDASSIEDLSFEEGIVRIGASAFRYCEGLEIVAFPASLEVIEKWAFEGCRYLDYVSFPVGSQLQYIGDSAFVTYTDYTTTESSCAENVPVTVREIDPDAFDLYGWDNMTWDGPPPFIVNDYFLCSADSRIVLRCFSEYGQHFSENKTRVIPAPTEVIGRRAFYESPVSGIGFDAGTKLREICEEAFSRSKLTSFNVPSSVETIGDRCFAGCVTLKTITFEEVSRLKRIGEGVFAGSGLISITIPASIEEIDGSAFVDCQLLVIRVAEENQNFKIQGSLLTTADYTEIVRSFGRERTVIIRKTVEVLGKSCFQSCCCISSIVFEPGSPLRRICRSAFAGCEFLRSIAIPASVEVIEESAFKKCDGLEECLMEEDANLVMIGKEAFADCCSLKSFHVSRSVERIGEGCFGGCGPLRQLRFRSLASLKKIVGDFTLDEALENIGFDEISSLFRIEVEDGGADFEFGGWVSRCDTGSILVLMHANE
jgi:hypothetical protein